MANGIEDLKEKNKDDSEKDLTKSEFKFWTKFQGREDAEMLQEKSFNWSAAKSSRGDYDSYDDDE